MFISACFEFGKIDTIGHSAIIAILVAMICDSRPGKSDRRLPWLAPVGLCAALTVTLFAYYVGHAALFHTSIL
jgi:Na+/melibiose symporter-like transporter